MHNDIDIDHKQHDFIVVDNDQCHNNHDVRHHRHDGDARAEPRVANAAGLPDGVVVDSGNSRNVHDVDPAKERPILVDNDSNCDIDNNDRAHPAAAHRNIIVVNEHEHHPCTTDHDKHRRSDNNSNSNKRAETT